MTTAKPLRVWDEDSSQWLLAGVAAKGDKGDKGDTGDQGPPGEAGGSEWGDIDGTLSDQTDLQSALNGKLPADNKQVRYFTATSATGGSTNVKVATTAGGDYSPSEGDLLRLSLTNSHTGVGTVKVNVDGSGEVEVRFGDLAAGGWASDRSVAGLKQLLLWFDGSGWQLLSAPQNFANTVANVANLASASCQWRGEWASNWFSEGSVVTHSGDLYMAVAYTEDEPPSGDWKQIS